MDCVHRWSNILKLILLFFVEQFPAISLFSVVQFPNEECTTGKDNSVKGICMNSDECTQKGGTSDGNCASGFGMCCKIT